ncbi:SAF domain-containing protein [Tumebacillus permanentifrigoris]|uniref:Flagellar basal body P-ring formation chaperone FlgA n=1 Tax=Tumebacillus permanentifrigoris TaxID=378543 RepID=A0A316D2J3_9BACL|nr:SAF domain-containing protein [Tumebacillus permanentifrigoris]PWK05014.1 flagellar basal body P-ring formation chaperone FlgA [Tumebacillus permanentifrigoris]
MSVLRQRTSQRTKKLLVAGAIGALGMGVLSSGVFAFSIVHMQNSNAEREREYQKTIQENQQMLQKEQQTKKKVYVASKDIEVGTSINASDLVAVDVTKDAVPDDTLNESNGAAGKYAKITIKKNTPLTKAMLYDEGVTPDDIRAQEFRLILLPSDLKINQFLDVRIKFPTGQDYITLAKKKVKQLQEGTVWFDMNEKEIQMFSSAIVDAYQSGATIYALSYVDPFVQEKSIVDYPVNAMVRTRILADPNILSEAKRGLEEIARLNLEYNLRDHGTGGTAPTLGKIDFNGAPMNTSLYPGAGGATRPSTSNSNATAPKTGVQDSVAAPRTDRPAVAAPSASAPNASPDSQKSIFESNIDHVVSP